MTMYEELEDVFKSDCIETHNYTEEEAKVLLKEKGEDFIDSMINDLWDNWSENFPVNTKEKEE